MLTQMELLTDVADVKLQVDISSLINNFINDYKFENRPYAIILICILQIFLQSGILSMYMHCENRYPENRQNSES